MDNRNMNERAASLTDTPHKAMKFLYLYSLLLFSIFLISCNKKRKVSLPVESPIQAPIADTSEADTPTSVRTYRDPFRDLNLDAQLMMVLRRVFQDKKENLWFVGDGVFCYTGDSLIDFSNHEVFHKTVVRQIAEDPTGNIWFGTSEGIIKYIPSEKSSTGLESFSKFSEEEGLSHRDVWSMAIDKTGNIWVGTLEGVSRFNGEVFTPFELPESELDDSRGVTSTKIVHSILEDSKGNMWFGSNGGAYIYDGTSLSLLSEEEGLCNNSVNHILEDKKGNIWFATHNNSVCRWDGNSFTHLSEEEGVQGLEAWSIYEDRAGNIWFPIENSGVYRYDPSKPQVSASSLSNFHKEEGLPMNGVHTIREDKAGQLWFGGFGGLYRYDGKSFVNVTQEGPWDN